VTDYEAEADSTATRLTCLRILGWIGSGLAVLVVLLLLALSVIDLNVLKRPIERIASARSGRSVRIGGRLEDHVWSRAPGVTINELTVGNPPWESARPMLQVRRLQVRVRLLPLLAGRIVIEQLDLDDPVVYLHRELSGRANWTSENLQPSDEPARAARRLPMVHHVVVSSGKLTLADEILRLNVEATVQAHEEGTPDDPRALRIEGKGTVNKQPLDVQLLGGPLTAVETGRPYPFDLQVAAGNIHLESAGQLRTPFDLGHARLDIRASGDDLANLYYLTRLAFPNTPAFQLRASIERDGDRVRVAPAAGQLGESDVHGQLDIDLSRKRPMVTGELVSTRLRLRDLAQSLGGEPEKAGDGSAAAGSSSPTREPRHKSGTPAAVPSDRRLFPDAHLQMNRVRAMNADVRFTAGSIEAGNVPLRKLTLHVKLNDGLLELDPLEFQMSEGELRGTASIDARGRVPDTHLDLRVNNIELSQFKGRSAAANPPLSGELQARVLAEGLGDSVHDFVSDASGTATFVLPHGEIRSAFAELTGIDVVEGLGLLLKGGKGQEAVRCGVAQFALHDGVMSAQQFVVDTRSVRITGRGELLLGPEELNLSLNGYPKRLRLTRLKAPVRITGHLLEPSIGISAGSVLKQGAIATTLGAALSPLAAVLAFVDPGLTRDENCAALLAGAQDSVAPTVR
jgi:AsmA family protein